MAEGRLFSGATPGPFAADIVARIKVTSSSHPFRKHAPAGTGTMTTNLSSSGDPFVDPQSATEDHTSDHAFAADATLVVGRNASLTLGTDSLIVLGEQDNI